MTSRHLAIVKDGKIELLNPLSIPEDNNTEKREDWENFSLNNLNQCYAENEPEYTLESIKEYNPDYEKLSHFVWKIFCTIFFSTLSAA